MSTPKTVQIPYDTFISLIDALQYIDLSNYDESFKMQFEGIVSILEGKKRKLELRDTYSGILKAKDEDTRDLARIEYLRKRNQT